MGEVGKKPRISAASARSHTRKDGNKRGLPSAYAALLRKVVLILVAIVGSLFYKAITPSPLKVLNSPDGPQVTAPRVEMRDGRYLAYKEVGVEREDAKHFIVTVHGLYGSRHLTFPISKEVVNELGLYIVSFDRAGYGQSDPNPKRSIRSEAEDVEDLAIGLALGPKFYVIATSTGAYTGYGLLKYIPDRLAGIAFSAPVVNFWWPGLPLSELKAAWDTQKFGDKMALRVAHYAPALFYWYMTQTWFPTASVASKAGITAFSQKDQEIIKMLATRAPPEHWKESTQQGAFESAFRDLRVMFGKWDFTPMSLENPFDIPVHIWQGTEDYLVPVVLQRQVARSLPWARYHELSGHGHWLNAYPGFPDNVVRALLKDSKIKNPLQAES